MSQSVTYSYASAVLAPPELPRRWIVLAVLLAAPFLAVLDGFITIVAVPSIQDQLHASDAGVQLVVAGYVVAYAGFLIAGGRLGDIHGRRRLLVLGLILFSATSICGAAAPNQDVLIAARFLQGASAALMYPQTLALIRVHFVGRSLTTAMAAFGVALGLAAVAAQLLGGVLVQENLFGLGWRSIFLVHLPVSVAAAGLALRLVPESRSGRATPLDLVGVLLVTGGLLTLVLPLIVGRELGWPVWTWALLASSVFLATLFVAHARRLAEHGGAPLIRLDLFRVRALVVGLAITLVFYSGQISFLLLLTLYLQHGLGLTPMATGLVFAPLALGFFGASVTAPKLTSRLGKHVLTLGAVGLIACTTTLSGIALQMGGEPAVVAMLPVLFLCGAGYGLVIPTLVGVVLRVMPADYEGAASGVLVTTQQVGGAVGIAVSGVLFFGLLHAAVPVPYATAFSLALCFNIGLFVLTALLVQVIRDERRDMRASAEVSV